MKFSEISVREKRSLFLGCMAVVAFLVWQLGIRPAQSRLASLSRIVDSKEQMLEDTRQMSQEIDHLKAEIEDLDTLVREQPNSGRILAMLEQIQVKNNIDKLGTRMRPTTMSLGEDYEQINVNLVLTDIALEKLVALLVDIQAMKLVVGVQHLTAQQIPASEGHLKVTIDIQTIVPSSSP